MGKRGEFVLDEWLPYRLVVTADEVSRAFARLYRQQFGLTRYQWRVLSVVAAEPGVTAAVVCRASTLEKMQVSRAVSDLRDEGMLTATQDPKDRREYRLRLTRRGWALYRRLTPLARDLEERLLADISAAQRQALTDVLPLLRERAAGLQRDADEDQDPA